MRILLLAVVAAAGCSKTELGPVPIAYGEDECSLCRMFISEAPFAAEARFGAGEFEKFDDIGCLGERMWKGTPAAMWVADHSTSVMKPLESLVLVHSNDVKTPMASGVAAFSDRAEAETFRARHRGRFVSWEDVKAMRRPRQ